MVSATGSTEILVEGESQGRLLNLRENVLDALQVRFGDIPAGLREAIGELEDETKLRQLLRLGIQCPSLEVFAAG